MSGENETSRSRAITNLDFKEARAFLLKGESYGRIDLPLYLKFDDLLGDVDQFLGGRGVRGFQHYPPSEKDYVNYLILNNKDGRYAWRPLELIHPVLYVSLVNKITEECNWSTICSKFQPNKKTYTNIECMSLPVESLTKEKDEAEQVTIWLEKIEQKSLELSLDYEFVINTDVVNCYADIYTHSIAWAIHGKTEAKNNRRNDEYIGNIIDQHIQDMRYGQTNGIPQGSLIMDFVAEMVLGYADTELADKINNFGIEDYQILRYRDDYRIFINRPKDGEQILKCLTEVMISLGLKLNPLKTNLSSEVVRTSIKKDKLSWMFRRQGDKDLQKHLLTIHDHALAHPNSGSVTKALNEYFKRIGRLRKYGKLLPTIGIMVDIAFRNPRTYPISAAILSKLISLIDTDSKRRELVQKIRQKFRQLPNTGHMEIWLQRISLEFNPKIEFDEPICRLVDNENVPIWNNDWISSKSLLRVIDVSKIIDREMIREMKPVVSIEEVELFRSDHY